MNESVAGSTAEVNNHFGVGLIICTEHEVDTVCFVLLMTINHSDFGISDVGKTVLFDYGSQLNCCSNCDFVITCLYANMPNPLFKIFDFYRAMHFSAKRGIAIACRLSVCLSVCL